jgi:hypothetical protein
MRCYDIECREHDLNIQIPVPRQIIRRARARRSLLRSI